jgi:hypothetical protein
VRLKEYKRQQRVIDNVPIITIKRITDAPPIMKARNPTAKRQLKNTPQTHQQHTRNNTPGAVPMIKSIVPVIQHVIHSHDPTDPKFSVPMLGIKCNIAGEINTKNKISNIAGEIITRQNKAGEIITRKNIAREIKPKTILLVK